MRTELQGNRLYDAAYLDPEPEDIASLVEELIGQRESKQFTSREILDYAKDKRILVGIPYWGLSRMLMGMYDYEPAGVGKGYIFDGSQAYQPMKEALGDTDVNLGFNQGIEGPAGRMVEGRYRGHGSKKGGISPRKP